MSGRKNICQIEIRIDNSSAHSSALMMSMTGLNSSCISRTMRLKAFGSGMVPRLLKRRHSIGGKP